MARRRVVGRQEIVTPRGPVNVTGSPASEASSRIPSTSALSRRANEVRASRHPGPWRERTGSCSHHVEITQHLLLLVLILDEFGAKPETGQGARRSWDIAAIMRVRSSLKRRNLSCMRLKASIVPRTSRDPRGRIAEA